MSLRARAARTPWARVGGGRLVERQSPLFCSSPATAVPTLALCSPCSRPSMVQPDPLTPAVPPASTLRPQTPACLPPTSLSSLAWGSSSQWSLHDQPLDLKFPPSRLLSSPHFHPLHSPASFPFLLPSFCFPSLTVYGVSASLKGKLNEGRSCFVHWAPRIMSGPRRLSVNNCWNWSRLTP